MEEREDKTVTLCGKLTYAHTDPKKKKKTLWLPHSLLLNVEESERSRRGQVVEVARTPPTLECGLVS